MKKSFKTLFTIFMLTAFFILQGSAQTIPDQIIKDETKFHLTRTIKLSNASESKEVKMEVEIPNCQFEFNIQSWINRGELEIEVYDPNGKKQASFSVGCQIDSQSNKENSNQIVTDFFNGKNSNKKTETKPKINESVAGSTSKTIQNPILGDWIVKFIPKNTDGTITVAARQVKSSK